MTKNPRPCALSSTCTTRRDFIERSAFAVAAAAFALTADRAEALPVTFADGMALGDERQYPWPAADGVTIDRKEQIIIVRYQAHIIAFNLSCPHENTALKWLPKDMRFQCPKHESKYQPNGTFTSGRATRNMDRLAIRHDGASLVVDLSHIIKSDTDPAGWAAATLPA